MIVQSAWNLLNDRIDDPERMVISYPWNQDSVKGSQASRSLTLGGEGEGPHRIVFKQRDDYTGPTTGYHVKEMLVDNQIVWEEDVAGGDREWEEFPIDLTEVARGKESLELKFRIYDYKGVSNFGVDFEVQGVVYDGLSPTSEDWNLSAPGAWAVEQRPPYVVTGAFGIPLIVMIASNRHQFSKRNGDPATADRIRDKVQMAITQMRSSFAEGVVTYALPKKLDDDIYAAVWQLFLRTRRSEEADFNGNGSVDFDDFLLFSRAYGSRVGTYDEPKAAYDLDVDGQVAFSDFVLFTLAYDDARAAVADH